MHTPIHTLNDLNEETRLKVIEILNQSLADGIDLQMQIKQAHWNVKGADFIGVHELLDKIAEGLGENIDEIAERTAQLGGVAEGMGMGLTISRSIIEAHGGRLWFEDNKGPGTTFVFSLPAASGTAP